jgi:hypothetical protein
MNEKLIDSLCEHDLVYKAIEKKRAELTKISMENAQADKDLANIQELSAIRLNQLIQLSMDELLQDFSAIMADVPAGSNVMISVTIDGNAPVNKKCYKWDNTTEPPMMVRIRCDSPDVEGTIEY